MTDTHQHDEAASEVESGASEAGIDAEEPTYQTGGLRLALLILGLVAVGVVFGIGYVWMIVGLVVMIFLHELGHFVTAKWSGMKVTDFFIGFGPRIWSFQRGETQYGVKAIPAGAFVRIIGMNNLDETDPADEARTYRQQSFPKRLLVVSAGSIMHFIQAFVLLVILLTVVGVPGGTLSDQAAHDQSWRVGNVSEDSAAQAAGLKKGDDIVSFDGERVATWEDVTDRIQAHEVGDQVTFEVVRDGQTLNLSAELGPRPEGIGGEVGSPFLGLGAQYPTETVGLGSALVQAPKEMALYVGNTLGTLAGLFSPSGISDMADNVSQANDHQSSDTNTSGSQVSSDDNSNDNRLLSILGVMRLGAAASEEGIGNILVIFFAMNVFIGIFNMLPLPPLDGGHAAVAIYERARSRRGRRYYADAARILPVTYAVVMVLVVIGVTALYLDVVSPIKL